jgi:hypothetical protein
LAPEKSIFVYPFYTYICGIGSSKLKPIIHIFVVTNSK